MASNSVPKLTWRPQACLEAPGVRREEEDHRLAVEGEDARRCGVAQLGEEARHRGEVADQRRSNPRTEEVDPVVHRR